MRGVERDGEEKKNAAQNKKWSIGAGRGRGRESYIKELLALHTMKSGE